MLTVIHINGPINSGKSTVGQALSRLLPDAVFVDGDDHDAPDDAPLTARVQAALRRLEAHIAGARGCYLVAAYPYQASYKRLEAASEARGARFLVLTLAPPVEVALTDRGTRKLSPEEKERIVEMYQEGYHARPFSSLVLDTAGLTPHQAGMMARAMILSAVV
jgi:hypothetical protein